MKIMLQLSIVAFGFGMLSCSKAEITTNKDEVISYKSRISPIIAEKCLDCHSMESSFPMAKYEQLVQEGINGKLTAIINTENHHIPFPMALEKTEKEAINLWVNQNYPE
jgi:hypothetical protein